MPRGVKGPAASNLKVHVKTEQERQLELRIGCMKAELEEAINNYNSERTDRIRAETREKELIKQLATERAEAEGLREQIEEMEYRARGNAEAAQFQIDLLAEVTEQRNAARAEAEGLKERADALALQADEWEGKYAIVSEENAKLRATIHQLGENAAKAAREYAEEVEAKDAEIARLRHEATTMWRNAVTNTIALFDIVRARHGGRGRGSGKGNPLDALKGDLDRHAQLWFDHSRAAKPTSYEEAEAEWTRFFATLQGGAE